MWKLFLGWKYVRACMMLVYCNALQLCFVEKNDSFSINQPKWLAQLIRFLNGLSLYSVHLFSGLQSNNTIEWLYHSGVFFDQYFIYLFIYLSFFFPILVVTIRISWKIRTLLKKTPTHVELELVKWRSIYLSIYEGR